jgi:type VI secretion system protein ImpF
MAGSTLSGMDIAALESRIHAAITEFEPRLIPETLRVEATTTEKSTDHHNQIEVQIRGSLWAQPVPIEILLKTEVDLESGQVEIQDLGG